ncbi:MAG: hypothetical protein IPF51_13765 [Dehalococcoidia bacterium]|nr:hypothetical protein [Dehalococcoidia bacterium]
MSTYTAPSGRRDSERGPGPGEAAAEAQTRSVTPATSAVTASPRPRSSGRRSPIAAGRESAMLTTVTRLRNPTDTAGQRIRKQAVKMRTPGHAASECAASGSDLLLGRAQDRAMATDTGEFASARRNEAELNERQRTVLDLLVAGKTNAEIGDALGMSLDGAKWNVSEILTKLGLDGEAGALGPPAGGGGAACAVLATGRESGRRVAGVLPGGPTRKLLPGRLHRHQCQRRRIPAGKARDARPLVEPGLRPPPN